MKRFRPVVLLAFLTCVCISVAACSPGGASTVGTPPASNATATPQPTAKPKPTGVPKITGTLCQQLMSVDEANNIMQPKIPATTIVADSSDTGGSCNYEASKSDITLIIYFFDWNGPNPIPQSDIEAALAQATNAKITINKAIPIDGIGDQAEYVEATAEDHGFTGVIHIFYVLDGKMIFDCFTFNVISGGAEATQSQLQQCAEQVFSRL